jgi:sugar phosphate isomerase/epimerase
MATNDVGTKYPLSSVHETGIEDLKRLGLDSELGNAYPESIAALWDLAVSAHAPSHTGEHLPNFGAPGGDLVHLNIAATDEDFRRLSIAETLGYVDRVREMPRVKRIVVHNGDRQRLDNTPVAGQQGDYGLMIDSIRQIADGAAEWGLEIVLENLPVLWPRGRKMSPEEKLERRVDDGNVPIEVPTDQVDWANSNRSFGVAPEEWIQICEDVDRENARLCLDPSHACTHAQTVADPERRKEEIMAYVSRPELIGHVHWSDNFLDDNLGRMDSHMLIGKGTLPVEFHQTIKGLDATLLLEHYYTV